MSFVSRGLSAAALIAVAIVAMLAPAPFGSSTGALGIQSVAATAPPVTPIYQSTIPSPAVSGHAGLYAMVIRNDKPRTPEQRFWRAVPSFRFIALLRFKRRNDSCDRTRTGPLVNAPIDGV